MTKIQNWFQTFALTVLLATPTTAIFSQNISDNDLKVNVTEVNVTEVNGALGKLEKLEPIAFEYNTDKYKMLNLEKGKQYGFMTDKFQNVFPELVSNKSISYTYGKNNDRSMVVQNMDTESLIPILVASVQELKAEIEQLKKELNSKNGNSNRASK